MSESHKENFMDQILTSRPMLKQDLYHHYLKQLEDTGLTSSQAQTMLSIWWDMMGWF